MSRVGFVGAGRMGAPMVRRLVEADHDVRVYGRDAEKCAAIEGLGAQPVTDLCDVAEGADVVVVCVFTDDQVHEVCHGSDLVARMKPGAALVVHTTGSPKTVQSIAARFDHIEVIDAPVSGGPHDIAAGAVTLFVGASDSGLERATPTLESYGNPILHCGGTGSGQLVKLVNNTLFAAQIGMVTEGVRLAARLGVAEGALLNALTHGSAQSRALSLIASAGSSEAFASAVGEFIGKDVAVVRETVADLGGDLGGLEAVVAAAVR
jgi:3-hydroxyisobutyrate dehydrogenase